MPVVPIGEILVRRELLDPNALRRALAEQASRGQRLVSMLITQTLIELDDGALALSEQLDYPAVLESDFEARSPSLAAMLSAEQGRAWAAVPLARGGDGPVIVAARDPSPALAAAIRETIGLPVVLAVGPAIYLERIIRAVYKGPADPKVAALAAVADPPPVGLARKTVRELTVRELIGSPAAQPSIPRTSARHAVPVEVLDKERSSRNEAPTSPPPMGRTAQSFDAPDPPKPRTITANKVARDQITKPPVPGYDPAASRRDLEDTKPPPLGRTAVSYDSGPIRTGQTRPPVPPRTSTSAALAGTPLITSSKPAPTQPPIGARTESFETETDTHMLPGMLRPPAPIPELVDAPLSSGSTSNAMPVSLRSITRDIEKVLSRQTAEKLVVKHLSTIWRSVLIVGVSGITARAIRGHGARLATIDKLTFAVAECSLLRVARDTGAIAMTTSLGDEADPLLELVGLPASAAPVLIEGEAIAIVAAGEPVVELAGGMQELTAMATALASAYLRFI